MKRKFLFGSLAFAVLFGLGNYAYAQQPTPTPAADNPCPELKPEQIKQLSDENKKKYEEELKKCKEALATNTKIKNATEVVNRSIKEGNAAFESKNYDVAIAKYDEGYNADPEYWGSAPILLRNKAVALRARGIAKFNAAVTNKDKAARAAGIADAAKDFQESATALQKAVDIFNKSTAPTDAAQAKNFNDNKFAILTDRAESYRLLIKADSSKAGDAIVAFEEYISAEPDAAKKQKAQLNLAQAIFTSGDMEKAIPVYRKVLEAQPNNPDALYELGSSLIAMGDLNNDKAMKQEGVALMERFLKAAPQGFDQAKLDDAKGQIEVNTAKDTGKPSAARPTGKKKN